MKKLMFAALVTAVAGGAFASPLVYKYKAAVQHMYLKTVDTGLSDADGEIWLYMKVKRSANLLGYLVMDQDGVTSKTVSGGACDPATTGAVSYDFGRNRGFLVVINKTKRADEDLIATPKIIPSILDAKWIDQRWDVAKMPTSGLAEGTLFCGGDSIACVRTILDGLAGNTAPASVDRGAAPQLPAANTPGMTAYADYVWTSMYLFGQFNGPNWYYDDVAAIGPYYTFEYQWDQNLPAGLQIGFPNDPTDALRHPYFHDTWMNGAGFGKYIKPGKASTRPPCCGLKGDSASWEIVLDTLSGAVKGGLFLCTENAIRAYVSNYDFFGSIVAPAASDTWRWENQFVSKRLVPANTFTPDAYQNDMWQDGSVEQETTDVISGSWRIGLKNAWAINNAVDLTAAEQAQLVVGTAPTYGLLCTLKAAALDLYSNAIFCDGREIHALTADECIAVEEGKAILPVITPQFATYYGLK